jgi:hypothetical protein
VLEIGMLGSTWRGLETGSSEHRASPRPYRLDLRNTAPVLDPTRLSSVMSRQPHRHDSGRERRLN